jgi:hypothetical protein
MTSGVPGPFLLGEMCMYLVTKQRHVEKVKSKLDARK